VITTKNINSYQVLWKNPKALIVVQDSIYELLVHNAQSKIVLLSEGKIELEKSMNIIGTLNPDLENEIIISAHWDSYNGPGASDNASGVGVMIELARYFSNIKPDFKIRFIAFGTEELGSLGSKSYVIKHKAEFKKCKMVFNIDQVGGYKDIYIEMRGGVRDVPNDNEFGFDLETANLAEKDYKGNWILSSNDTETSNVPAWLSDIISESCKELKIDFIPSNGMGSDHQIFFKSGVVATNICYYGDNKTHCPDDLPIQINRNGLEKPGKIIALTIEKVIERK
jgi:Zn-dependent M28 family amino/carboxypeptidase